MRTNLAERLGLEPEKQTRERRERLMEELRYREAMRRVAKTCCVWLGGAAFVLAVIAGYSIYWVTRTPRLNLLKSNAAIRGWLTVFLAGIEAQGVTGQPVAPLIVA